MQSEKFTVDGYRTPTVGALGRGPLCVTTLFCTSWMADHVENRATPTVAARVTMDITTPDGNLRHH
jgi:hypothetical protein